VRCAAVMVPDQLPVGTDQPDMIAHRRHGHVVALRSANTENRQFLPAMV
jgi:hypothetical protein